jgi:hypothetical protein
MARLIPHFLLMTKLLAVLLLCLVAGGLQVQQPVPAKPRLLVSTDIGGSDSDDSQLMTHLLIYSDKCQLEGLMSSPSDVQGSKQEILRTIDLYKQNLPKLAQPNT